MKGYITKRDEDGTWYVSFLGTHDAIEYDQAKAYAMRFTTDEALSVMETMN